MSARAEQLVLEYLSRVADEAHGVLRSDQRTRFVARVRAGIDQQRRASGALEPAEVRRLLAGFGDPKMLVERERHRLAAAPNGDRPVDRNGPPPRAVNGAPRPALNGSRPAPFAGPPDATADGATAAVSRRAIVSRAVVGRAAESVAPVSRAPVSRAPVSRTPVIGAPVREPRDTGADAGGAPVSGASSSRLNGTRLTAAGPRAVLARPAAARRSRAQRETAPDLMWLARTFGREIVALALLGLGGVLLPFPLWLIGVAIAVTSWGWTRLDKFVGLVGPLILTTAGIGLVGALNKNPSIPVDLHAYIAAAHSSGPLLLRIGAGAGAIFLAARLLHSYRAARRRSAAGQAQRTRPR